MSKSPFVCARKTNATIYIVPVEKTASLVGKIVSVLIALIKEKAETKVESTRLLKEK